ncbi:MAG: mechanosensitive ion channel family protein [Firmicutes bacterium]|nr:mechanosensitive ion channel family protein [Bacillota bacterium]
MNVSQLITDAARPVAILILAAIFVRIVGRMFKKLESTQGSQRRHRVTLYRLLVSALRYSVDFIVVVMILGQFHIQTASLIAGAGIIGLAISFGAQGLVQDVVTGIFLLYEDQFGVGERVTFPSLNLSGEVQEVGIRITRLIGPTGDTIVIPNRLILEVENLSRVAEALIVTVVVSVIAQEDPQKVRMALEEAVAAVQNQASEITLHGITGFGNACTMWTITASASPDSRAIVDQWIRQCVLDSFHRHAIQLA